MSVWGLVRILVHKIVRNPVFLQVFLNIPSVSPASVDYYYKASLFEFCQSFFDSSDRFTKVIMTFPAVKLCDYSVKIESDYDRSFCIFEVTFPV